MPGSQIVRAAKYFVACWISILPLLAQPPAQPPAKDRRMTTLPLRWIGVLLLLVLPNAALPAEDAKPDAKALDSLLRNSSWLTIHDGVARPVTIG